jgi:hypothetical protein
MSEGQSEPIAARPDANGVRLKRTPAERRAFRRRALGRTFKVLATLVVVYFIILNIPGLRNAVDQLGEVQPALLAVGLVLSFVALFCYSVMTRVALGPAGHHLSIWRMFRIQLSTRALSSLIPGGTAAGSALGYRLMTLTNVPGPDAGFALATSGLASAVVLNFILWTGLVVSIPLRGVNPAYGTAAVAGIILMILAAGIVFGLIGGQAQSEKIVRRIARRLRMNEERAGEAVNHISSRMQELWEDRALMRKLGMWAALNWLLDAAALWVFLRAFGGSLPIDGLVVAFGLANVLAAIPITPGGLGIVEGIYVPVLVGFGLPRATVVVGVVSYRIAQYWLPILVGGGAYLSLRVGPWAISKDRLEPLRDVVASAEGKESILDFSERYPARERTRELPKLGSFGAVDPTRPLSERSSADGEPPHEPM